MTFWYLLGYSLSKAIAKSFFHYRVIGAENMIEEGPCIIAANHCSYLDPPLVGVAFRRGIHYLARKSLLDVPSLARFCRNLMSSRSIRRTPTAARLWGPFAWSAKAAPC